MTQFAILFLSAVMLAGPAAPESKTKAGEMIDNPDYAHWAKFKVGSFATMKNTTLVGGHKSVALQTKTLKSVAKDKIVIEISMEIVGMEHKIPPQKMEIPAKILKPATPKAVTTQPKGKPDLKMKEGDETLDIDGKKIKAHWVETQTKVGEVITKSKIWSSEDVPGRMIKMTSRTEGPLKSSSDGIVSKMKADKK